MKNATLILCLLGLTGCGMLPLKPGHATFRSPIGAQVDVVQSQNPSQPTTQDYERITESVPNPQASTVTRTTERVKTSIGAAQKDTARDLAARLSSLKWVVWVGVLVFLFGAASLFYPPLKLIVGSTTTSVAACGAGLALIVLPTVVVGHELIIGCVGVGAVGIYWFAHRHATIHATLKALTSEKPIV